MTLLTKAKVKEKSGELTDSLPVCRVCCPMAFCKSLFCCGLQGGEKGRRKADSWRIFSLKELYSATNNFNYDNKLGEGGFGSVYWGQLWDGSQIAVKRLKVWSDKAEMEFAVEVEILGRVRHKNLLGLRGYCAEGQERLIVYDYMPNLSLLSHLHGQHSADCLLDWSRRMKIAIESAEAIVYLHHHATPHIIHRDIKASNVLLDSEFHAHVADFGFARLIPDGATHVTTKVKGTLGYLAPEYAMLGKASESCDVYSFGILLLELASGKKPIERIRPELKRTITEWALPLARKGKFADIADKRLNGNYVDAELKRVALVALVCAQTTPEKRPTMLEVVDLLKGVSKEKLDKLENNELFISESVDSDHGLDDRLSVFSEDKDPKAGLKEANGSKNAPENKTTTSVPDVGVQETEELHTKVEGIFEEKEAVESNARSTTESTTTTLAKEAVGPDIRSTAKDKDTAVSEIEGKS